MHELISSVTTAKLDYIKIVEANTFEIINELLSGNEVYILIACRIGKTRLIDNVKIKV
ncbi:MAG: pantoate--beta-alanine ligase [Ignavibacteriaceae bacterium]|nr:pantoate--beta-alanine ligase [Ignavibacteriaceae bacterium]